VDVNFVQRIPLFGVEERHPRFPPGGDTSAVPVLTLEELAAGKCAALLARAAPRDAFDAWQLLELVPDLLARPALRLAFVVQAGSVREDLRSPTHDRSPVTEKAVQDELLPLLRVEARPFGGNPDQLARTLTQVRQTVASTLLTWRNAERAFLDRLIDAGEVEASLLTEDPALQDRIAAQPMLRWKAMHVRQFHGVPTPESEGDDGSV
jgi:hypothetical protein